MDEQPDHNAGTARTERSVTTSDRTPEIVLLHGLIGTLDNASVIGAFGDRIVHAPALLGYGAKGETAPETWSLDNQAEHVATFLRARGTGPVHVVGHSVGGAVSVILAVRHPELVRSLCSVEGNKTLDDAFWSADIARRPVADIEALLESHRDDVDQWLTGAGIMPTAWTRDVEAGLLGAQPAQALRTQAAAVCATGEPDCLRFLEERLSAGLPLHLVAGERSLDGCSLPERIRALATSFTVIPHTGHLMMLESPEGFARAVLDAVDRPPSASRSSCSPPGSHRRPVRSDAWRRRTTTSASTSSDQTRGATPVWIFVPAPSTIRSGSARLREADRHGVAGRTSGSRVSGPVCVAAHRRAIVPRT